MNHQNLESRTSTLSRTGIRAGMLGALLSAAVAYVGGGCSHTIHYQDPSSKFWYDCQIDENYPSGHPCEKPISKYIEQKKQRKKREPCGGCSSGYECITRTYAGGGMEGVMRYENRCEKIRNIPDKT